MVTFSVSFEDFCEEFVVTNCRSDFCSKKYPSCKKNHLNQTSDGGDIADLKLAIF